MYLHRILLPGIALLLATSTLTAQVPDWFVKVNKSQAGTWIASNAAFKSDQETDDQYAITWTPCANYRCMTGELYGLRNGDKSNTYWHFYQYWSPEDSTVIVVQTGFYGGLGIGTMSMSDSSHISIDISFAFADSTVRKERNRTLILGRLSQVSTSHRITEDGEWVEDRTYVWKRKIR